jgi:hypothetical protein
VASRAEGSDPRFRDETAPGVAVRRVSGVTARAVDLYRLVLSDRVVGGATASLRLRFGDKGSLVRGVDEPGRRGAGTEDRRVALSTLGIADREPHVGGFRIGARKEPEGIEARDRPDLEAHRRVGTAVTGDASDGCLALVMKSGEIRAGGRNQSAKFLVVQMAGDAETVVPLLRGESGQEHSSAHKGSDNSRPPDHQAVAQRAMDRRSLGLADRDRYRLGEHDAR